MGLLDTLKKAFDQPPPESNDEIRNKINNSEAAAAFLNEFSCCLELNGSWCKFLLGNSKKRSIFLDVEKVGIIAEFLDFSSRSDYTVDKKCYGFGASGFADLPNYNYILALQEYLADGLTKNCPHLDIKINDSHIVIHVKETAKTGW